LALRRNELEEAVGWYGRARALKPNHAPTYVFLAEAARRQGDWSTAEASVRQALALDAKSFDGWVLLGDVLRQGESSDARRAEARAAYDTALKLLPNDAWAQRQLGTLLADTGEDARAEAVLKRVKDTFPNDGAIRLLLGHMAMKRRSYVEALSVYREAMAATPTAVEPAVFAGRAALALERFDEADALFRGALELQPESGWAHLERGYGQRARRDWGGALTSAEKATRFAPKNPEGWLFLGRLRQEKRDTEAALLAYERASELAPTSPYADRALASALANRGTPEDLLRSEGLLKRPLAELGDVGYTHAVAGYTYVRLAKTLELNLPPPLAPDTRVARRARWNELGAFELSRAVELSPDDRSLRLAGSVGLFELGRFEESRRTVTPLLELSGRTCPVEEWSWQWNAKGTPIPPEPADTPEQVQALQDEQLRSEAHLLSGDLFARESAEKARLAYFCALEWLPWRADAHLRLGASYEATGLVRLAEQHFLTALQMEPTSTAATLGLERLRKEGGFPVGPVRVGALGSFVSDFVPGEVQARQATTLGFTIPALQQSLLTTPRTLTIGANATWQKPEWRSGLRLGLDYRFLWGFNTFLNDLLAFEDRRAHLVEVMAAGRTAEFKDKRFELSWRGGYRLTVANSATRNELRHTFTGSARLLRVDWGFADAELGYELGTFAPTPLAPVLDTVSHSGFGGVRATHVIRRYQLELSAGYRLQVVALVPSGRTIAVHELLATAQKTWGPWALTGELRGGFTSDARDVLQGPSAFAGSIMPRGSFGYAWSGYSRVMGRAGVSLVPGQPRWDSVLVGAAGEHRFVFQGFGDADQGLSASLSYDARISYGLGRVEHLVSAVVTLGR
ncbi:MAG: tetratricopeptide repeat protein, partial [Archangium sp.]|nr:tetratricopeptide repeat protein [Archangium sp.]